MHIDATNPPTHEDLIRTMNNYGLPIYITELDIDLSGFPTTMSEKEKLIKQAKIYTDILDAAIQSGVCKRITFWDMGDKYSWLEVYQNKPNADPTLFDSQFNPKPAYYAILQKLLKSLL